MRIMINEHKRRLLALFVFPEQMRCSTRCRGAFRWIRNAMYAFAFLGLWSIALFADSTAALILAILAHACVWVHYYATEKPDMDLIYG